MLIIDYDKKSNKLKLTISWTPKQHLPFDNIPRAEKKQLISNLVKAGIDIDEEKYQQEAGWTIWQTTSKTYIVDASCFSSIQEIQQQICIGFTPYKDERSNAYAFNQANIGALTEYFKTSPVKTEPSMKSGGAALSIT